MRALLRHRSVLAALLLAAATLTGCSASGAPAGVCVPELTVTPSHPHPGKIVTVTTSRACPVQLSEGDRWRIRIQPDGRRIPLAQAFVRPGGDGAFTLSITVPPTMPEGPAIAWIVNYWDLVDCPGDGDCARVAARFTVGERLE